MAADPHMPDGRIKLDVLGGFLGSGKTTWLRHQLHVGAMDDALVIVNEAAETPVDDALLVRSARTEVLAGGCACCDGRQALVALLRRLCDERVAADDVMRVNRMVLETSGLADPGAISDIIRVDPVLQHHILVREIIVAVDGLHGLAQLRTEALGRRQVETADRIFVTKVDEAEPHALGVLLATLRTMNPGAALSAAIMGEVVPVPDFSRIQPESLPGISAGEQAPITATTLEIDESIDWPAFTLWLSALLHARGDDIVRVKGVIRAPAGRVLLQGVRRIVQTPEILPDSGETHAGDNTLVLIGRGFNPAHLMPSLRRFAGRS